MATITLTKNPLRRAGRGLLEILTGPHGVDRYVEIIDPRLASDRHLAEIITSYRETDDTVTLVLQAPQGWETGALERPRPGQAVTITVEVDGIRHRRAFSVASMRATTFTLTIRANPNGIVSRHLVANARPGLLVEVGPPFGELVLPRNLGTDLLLVSGGSGITPVMANLRQLLIDGLLAPASTEAADRAHLPKIAFLHYTRTADDQIFHGELAAMSDAFANLTIRIVHTSESGHFAPEHLDGLDVDLATARIHACGPAGLVADLRDHLDATTGSERLRIEVFHPPVVARTGAPAGGTIRLTVSEQTIVDDARSILEQAEAAGLAPAHGCRMGICHTCTRSVTSGAVRNVIDGTVEVATDAAPVSARICVSAPHGDCAIDL